MIEKAIVEKNFSKNAQTYDKYALVQKQMAEHLIKICDKEIAADILEIGCGTGCFSELLLEKYKDANITFVDISTEMLKIARSRLGDAKKKYINCDAEAAHIEGEYDLITGNAVIQWFTSLEKGILNLYNNLKNDGSMIFSTFGEKTFCELKDSFLEAEIEYNHSQRFYTKAEIEEICQKNNWNVSIEEGIYIDKFASLLDFLKSIKKIGASSAVKDKKVLTKGQLDKISGIYNKKYSDHEGINVTNHVIYIKIKKEKRKETV